MEICVKFIFIMYDNLDLPKGAKWFLKGANLPSFRVSLAPLGRCWNVYNVH